MWKRAVEKNEREREKRVLPGCSQSDLSPRRSVTHFHSCAFGKHFVSGGLFGFGGCFVIRGCLCVCVCLCVWSVWSGFCVGVCVGGFELRLILWVDVRVYVCMLLVLLEFEEGCAHAHMDNMYSYVGVRVSACGEHVLVNISVSGLVRVTICSHGCVCVCVCPNGHRVGAGLGGEIGRASCRERV